MSRAPFSVDGKLVALGADGLARARLALFDPVHVVAGPAQVYVGDVPVTYPWARSSSPVRLPPGEQAWVVATHHGTPDMFGSGFVAPDRESLDAEMARRRGAAAERAAFEYRLATLPREQQQMRAVSPAEREAYDSLPVVAVYPLAGIEVREVPGGCTYIRRRGEIRRLGGTDYYEETHRVTIYGRQAVPAWAPPEGAAA